MSDRLSAAYDSVLEQLRAHRDLLTKAIDFLTAAAEHARQLERVPPVAHACEPVPAREPLPDTPTPPPPARTAAKIDETKLLELHAAGRTDREIAEHFGCTDAAVYLRRRKLGLPSNAAGRQQVVHMPTAPEAFAAAKLPQLVRAADAARAAAPAPPPPVDADAMPISLRDLLRWFREIRTHVEPVEPGKRYRVNGRTTMTPDELLALANTKRDAMKQPRFRWSAAQ